MRDIMVHARRHDSWSGGIEYAADLVARIDKATDSSVRYYLCLGLQAVVARLDAPTTVRYAHFFVEAMGKTTDVNALYYLAQALQGVGARLGDRDAAGCAGQTQCLSASAPDAVGRASSAATCGVCSGRACSADSTHKH